MCTLQRVINLLKKVNAEIRAYVVCLLLTAGKKNCAEMARTVGLSASSLYKFLSNGTAYSKEIEIELFRFAKITRDKRFKRTLVIDPTAIIKRYAEQIEKLCYDKDGCTKHVEKVIVPVCASVVDERVKIPLTIDFWLQRKARGTRRYRSKVEIAQELISYLTKQGIDYDFASLDGAFPSPDMVEFFAAENNKKSFIMRIPRSRAVTLANGKRMQLQHVPELKLLRNAREKTIKAELYGRLYFFTAYKRKKRGGGWETVFLVSNMDLTAKQKVEAFNLRWPQEKINRTSKQKFGMHQCQALDASKQKAHIMAGYLGQAIIELAKIDKQEQSTDEIINFLRRNHFDDLAALIRKPVKKQKPLRHDYIDFSSQNCAQKIHNNAGESNVFMM